MSEFRETHLVKDATPYPLVSFITVNYHQPEVTLDLLASLQKLTYPNWECVVVNNGDKDDRLFSAIQKMEKVQYLDTGKNLGFAGGNNKGLAAAKGKYLYFINNDTEVSPDILEPMVELAEKTPDLGMVSSKILFFHDKATIQYAGFTELQTSTMRNSGIGFGEEDRGQYDDIRTTAFVHGASMMVPARVIKEVGPMHEDYFLYYEEYDWCQRVKNAGYQIYYCGPSKIYHKESISTGEDSPLKTYYLTRNRLLFARRNFKWKTRMAAMLYFAAVAMPIHLLKKLSRGQIKQAMAMIKGFGWNLSHKARIL